MTPDEAKSVLAAATTSAHFHQWDDVDHLLRHVYEQQVLTGADQGDAAYLLGISYVQTGAWDAAHAMLTEASTTASPDNQANARDQLVQIGHQDAATDAELSGAVDQTNVASVLTAADDALQRGDLDGAYAHYWKVYDGQADDDHRARGALGIARVHAYRNELTEALQYAEYVEQSPSAAAAQDAKALVAWIKEQQGADTATADGTTADEYKQVMEAGRSAFFQQDYAQARELFLSVLDAQQLASTEHAKAAYNAGMTEEFLGLEAEAREHYEFVVAHGATEAVGKAQRRLTAMDQHETAEHLVAELAD